MSNVSFKYKGQRAVAIWNNRFNDPDWEAHQLLPRDEVIEMCREKTDYYPPIVKDIVCKFDDYGNLSTRQFDVLQKHSYINVAKADELNEGEVG